MTGTILKKENSNCHGKLNVVLSCVLTSILDVPLCFFFFFKKNGLKLCFAHSEKNNIGH
jgi:hypothetical protein